jgi:hypothetical protein
LPTFAEALIAKNIAKAGPPQRTAPTFTTADMIRCLSAPPGAGSADVVAFARANPLAGFVEPPGSAAHQDQAKQTVHTLSTQFLLFESHRDGHDRPRTAVDRCDDSSCNCPNGKTHKAVGESVHGPSFFGRIKQQSNLSSNGENENAPLSSSVRKGRSKFRRFCCCVATAADRYGVSLQ